MAQTESESFIGELKPMPDTDVEVEGVLADNFNRAFGWIGYDGKPNPRSATVIDYRQVAGSWVLRPKSTYELLIESGEGRIDVPHLGWNYGVGIFYTLLESIVVDAKEKGISNARKTVADICNRSYAAGKDYIAYLKEQAKAGATNATANMQARLDFAESISKKCLAEKAINYLKG